MISDEDLIKTLRFAADAERENLSLWLLLNSAADRIKELSKESDTNRK